MYIIKMKYLEKLLTLSEHGYPDEKVIKAYMKGNRMAQENTVRIFASLLKENDWRVLVS